LVFGGPYRTRRPHARAMPNLTNNGSGDEEEEEEVRTLVIRAMDGDWIMGDDVVLPVTGDETVVDIQQIKGIKGVPTTRMVAFKEGEENRISDKHLTWSLSRNGLYAGDVLVIRPSRPNQWLWHPFEWYEKRLLKSAEDIASSSPWAELRTGCPLSVLQERITVPPPLSRDSLKAILRKFPDRLRLQLDVVSQKFVVFPNRGKMLLPLSY
ncbi:unnamed protein product, partial [Pylaiella littoralis]